MIIEHVAIWTHKLEEMKDFYVKYFNTAVDEKYVTDEGFPAHFELYFLSFDSGARLELCQMSTIPQGDAADGKETTGLTHIALSAGSRAEVDRISANLKRDGYKFISDPRLTGDGYYESCVLDPDGNRVEIITPPEK